MRRAAAILFLLLSSACQPVSPYGGVTYKPKWHTADRPRPSTAAAVPFYPGDAGRLDELEAKYLGKLLMHGPGSAKEAVFTQLAAEIAASNGGTHIFLVGEEDSEKTVGMTGGSSATSCWSATCITTTTPAAPITETKKTRVFAVYAVSPDRWADLAQGLRPAPKPPVKKAVE